MRTTEGIGTTLDPLRGDDLICELIDNGAYRATLVRRLQFGTAPPTLVEALREHARLAENGLNRTMARRVLTDAGLLWDESHSRRYDE